MRLVSGLLLPLLVLVACAHPSAERAGAAPIAPGFRPLRFQPQEHWRVEPDGRITFDGEGHTNLVSAEELGDLELRLDWKIGPAGDSGVYLRGTPQVQIWDPDNAAEKKNGADRGSGGLWNNQGEGRWPRRRVDRPVGSWNQFRIKMIGARVWVWLNGEAVVEGAILEPYKDKTRPVPARGPIELQGHGHPTEFRNVVVRDIPYEEAVQTLAGGDDQFRPLWNGKDFSGWAGAVDNYEIVDGTIRCAAGKGGTIFATEELTDFQVRLEFRLPPGGNNGLAIRYPGEGDTAYVGMTELQVLDDSAPQYATLDPRQFHGSAYGLVAAHRGYLRPVGAWNYEEVTVRGSTVKVELNGTVILDADLAQVSETMKGRPHPGKDRTSGHFGFAGHNDPVAYRNVRVRGI